MKTGRRSSAPSPATIPSSSSALTNGRPARSKRGLKATLADFQTTLPAADSTTESPRPSPSPSAPAQLRTAIAGVSGYAGGELARLLLNHPRLGDTAPTLLGRPGENSTSKLFLTDLHPQLATTGAAPEVAPFSWDRLVEDGIEVLFLATPHEQS